MEGAPSKSIDLIRFYFTTRDSKFTRTFVDYSEANVTIESGTPHDFVVLPFFCSIYGAYYFTVLGFRRLWRGAKDEIGRAWNWRCDLKQWIF